MREVRFTDRLRYAFDNSMSRGAIALIGYLALASLALILVAALVLVVFRIAPDGKAARRRGEVAIGYRHLAQAKDAAKAYGVVVNPKKSEQVTFAAGDQVIVLAEE